MIRRLFCLYRPQTNSFRYSKGKQKKTIIHNYCSMCVIYCVCGSSVCIPSIVCMHGYVSSIAYQFCNFHYYLYVISCVVCILKRGFQCHCTVYAMTEKGYLFFSIITLDLKKSSWWWAKTSHWISLAGSDIYCEILDERETPSGKEKKYPSLPQIMLLLKSYAVDVVGY